MLAADVTMVCKKYLAYSAVTILKQITQPPSFDVPPNPTAMEEAGRYSRRERKKRGLGDEAFAELEQLIGQGGRRSQQFKVGRTIERERTEYCGARCYLRAGPHALGCGFTYHPLV
jgi:hypothetical protein